MEAAGMRFMVERDPLAEPLPGIARARPSRPVLPVLSGLLLQAAADGLTLSCFDYEVSARISIDADVTEPGTALVPGRLLAEITRSLPGHPVEVDDKDDVTLTCGPASFRLVTLRGAGPAPAAAAFPPRRAARSPPRRAGTTRCPSSPG